MPTPWPTNTLTMPYLQHRRKGMAVSGACPPAAGQRAVCALLWHDTWPAMHSSWCLRRLAPAARSLVLLADGCNGVPNLLDGHAGAAHLDGCRQGERGQHGKQALPSGHPQALVLGAARERAEPLKQKAKSLQPLSPVRRPSSHPPASSASLVASHSWRAAGGTLPT